MRILYGVVGEGMGHAMRSRVVVDHLLAENHQVEIMASSRAADFLAARFRDVHRIHGLHIIYDENRVRRGATLFSNAIAGTAAAPQQIAAYFRLIEDFRPDIVVSDFESWAYIYAKAHGLPIVSLDNMQVINRCEHPPEMIEGELADFQIAKAFVKGKLPFCDHYLVTTFFYPKVRKDRTTLVPPVVRPEIIAATPTRGAHLLVYQTAEGNDALVRALEATGLECRVYGMRRGVEGEQVEGNLRYRPFAEQGFIDDLASARAVIAGGGFTLMSECVYLRKPMLSVPIDGQFEQVLNGRWLERLGYGLTTPELTAAKVHDFVARLPAFEARLATYHQDGNRVLFAELDGLLRSLVA